MGKSDLVMFSLSRLLPLVHMYALVSAAAHYDPVADPAAVVVFGGARFTLLTDALVRMEKPLVKGGTDPAAAVGEDRPTVAFVNRRLPVPQFTVTHPTALSVAIETDAFVLLYSHTTGSGHANPPPGFSNTSLAVTLKRAAKGAKGAPVWHPGAVPKGNLLGTAYSLDGVTGGVELKCWEPKARKGCTLAPISRDGWAVYVQEMSVRVQTGERCGQFDPYT